MPAGPVRKIWFENCRLEIKPHPHDRDQTLLRLFVDNVPQSVQTKTLKLLQYLADDHPNEEITDAEIALDVWGTLGAVDNVWKQISLLRRALGEPQNKPYKFIDTLPNRRGYRFIAKVRSEGDLGRLDGLMKWDPEAFLHFLKQVKRSEMQSEMEEDLRIVTTAFPAAPSEMLFEDLLKDGIRIRVLLMNPENDVLIHARYALREDKKGKVGPEELRVQIEQLPVLAKTDGCTGKLEWQLSDAMPCGFLAHASHGALVGLFLAHTSYTKGPMIQVPANTDLWKTLYLDWKKRWDNPAPNSAM